MGAVAFSVKNSCWMSRIWRWGPDPGTCRPGPGGRLLPGEGRPAEVGPLALRREGIVSTNNTCAAFGGGGCGGRGERGRIPFLARPHSISTFVFREVYCTQYQLAAVVSCLFDRDRMRRPVRGPSVVRERDYGSSYERSYEWSY